MTDHSDPPGAGLPKITREEFAALQRKRERIPDFIEKLLASAKADFDRKWGIDPESPTDYESKF